MNNEHTDPKIQVEEALDELREPLIAHGGNVELVDVDKEGGVVAVRLHGACVGCPLSELTLKEGIGEALKEKFAWIKEIKAVN